MSVEGRKPFIPACGYDCALGEGSATIQGVATKNEVVHCDFDLWVEKSFGLRDEVGKEVANQGSRDSGSGIGDASKASIEVALRRD